MDQRDHDRDRETLAKDAFDKPAAVDEIGGDPTGVMTGVDPGEEPIRPGEPSGETPIGNDPTTPGGGHGEGP